MEQNKINSLLEQFNKNNFAFIKHNDKLYKVDYVSLLSDTKTIDSKYLTNVFTVKNGDNDFIRDLKIIPFYDGDETFYKENADYLFLLMIYLAKNEWVNQEPTGSTDVYNKFMKYNPEYFKNKCPEYENLDKKNFINMFRNEYEKNFFSLDKYFEKLREYICLKCEDINNNDYDNVLSKWRCDLEK